MNFETIFLVSALIFVSLILLYEIVFILFFKEAKGASKIKDYNQTTAAAVSGEMEEILVQRKPLGYGEVSSRSFEQCATPVFELSGTPAAVLSSSNLLPVEAHVNVLEPEHKAKRIPVLVITPNDA